MAQKIFQTAKVQKLDEFYTQLADIERECSKYKTQFKDKIIFLNCDDPLESNFWRYFALNFSKLGIKKLVATHYDALEPSYKLELTGDMNEDGTIDDNDVLKIKLIQNGDFRSPECVELLKQVDIVVTNPPFSLFREYVAQLIEHSKDFLIIGNTNAITYKEIFKLFQQDKIRTGYTNFNTGMFFYVPDHWEKYHKIENGKKMVRVATSCWYTNLEVQKHKEDVVLYKSYSPELYPKYDNYDAINVNKYPDIPLDYEGVIGVPITFLDKWNPDQFELLGITDRQNSSGLRTKKYKVEDSPKFNDLNARSVLKTEDGYKAVYARLLIRNKRLGATT